MIGDSITHGVSSCNYTKIVQEKLLKDDFFIINAGVSADCTFDVVKRIEEIVKCRPKFITIMIGTNDSARTFELEEMKNKKYEKMKKKYCFETFCDEYKKIIEELKSGIEGVKIALISLPTIGENENEDVYKYTKKYDQKIKEFTEKYNLTYIPFSETLSTSLQSTNNENKSKQKPFEEKEGVIIKTVIYRFLFFNGYERASKRNGFLYHIDHLHLNEDGAKMVADLIVNWIKTM